MIEKSVRRFGRYPELIRELVALFTDAKATDQEVSRVNGSAPDGEHRRLRQVELAARGLDGFFAVILRSARLSGSLIGRSVIKWFGHRSGRPWRRCLASAPPFNSRYSSDWASARAEDNIKRKEVEDQRAAEEAERQAASKLQYEQSLRDQSGSPALGVLLLEATRGRPAFLLITQGGGLGGLPVTRPRLGGPTISRRVDHPNARRKSPGRSFHIHDGRARSRASVQKPSTARG